jgi:hypothetical protein
MDIYATIKLFFSKQENEWNKTENSWIRNEKKKESQHLFHLVL